MMNLTEHKGKLEFVKRIPRTHSFKKPVRFLLRMDGMLVMTRPSDPINNRIPELVGKECVAIIGTYHGKNALASIKLADELPEGVTDERDLIPLTEKRRDMRNITFAEFYRLGQHDDGTPRYVDCVGDRSVCIIDARLNRENMHACAQDHGKRYNFDGYRLCRGQFTSPAYLTAAVQPIKK
jgi:hypothetical protein